MNGDAVVVRQAKADDAARIGRVHVESWRSSYRGTLPDELLDGLSAERRAQYWQERIAEDLGSGSAQRVFVAQRSDGELVGFAAAGPDREADSGFDGELYAIYLLEEHKRKGLGRRLLGAVCEWFAALGYRSFRVWVLARNPARAFYEGLGGELAGSRPMEIGGSDYEEVAYGWRDLPALAERLSGDAGTGEGGRFRGDPSP